MQKIGLIGCGKLGISMALLCENKGIDVLATDVNETYLEKLRNKTLKSPEPCIEEFLKDATNISFSNNTADALEFSDLIFIFVATPSLESGEYDHQYIEEVVADILKYAENGGNLSGKALVISCTTMPTYCQKLQNRLFPLGINVYYNPEFIAQGSIVDGLHSADLVLIGQSDLKEETNEDLLNVYRTIMNKEPIFKVLSLTGAEMAKIATNCFLTMKISFGNFIGDSCIESGVEESEVPLILNCIGSDSRIGTDYMTGSFGYGGPCFPRDGKALALHLESVGMDTTLCKTIDKNNSDHIKYLGERFMKKNTNKTVPFLFTQVTYKKGVEMIVESQQLKLCIDFLKNGYRVNIQESENVVNEVKQIFAEMGVSHLVTYDSKAKGVKIN